MMSEHKSPNWNRTSAMSPNQSSSTVLLPVPSNDLKKTNTKKTVLQTIGSNGNTEEPS